MQEKTGSVANAHASDVAAPSASPAQPAQSPQGRLHGLHLPRWRRWTGHGIRITFWSVLALTLLFAGAVALARFWLIPNADSFRPRVVQELSRLTGQRVIIGGFEAGWNGWSPEVKMTRLQILDRNGRTLLQLPEVDTTVSWRSLFFFEPRLSALTIRAPRVIVRRTAENALTVAGIDLDLSAQTEADSGMIEWLLRQRLVQIAGGELEWQDEWRKLPPLRLRNVNVRLHNNGRRHNVGMTATPPSELAAPLDLRSEFSGGDLRRISDWDGLAYVRTDYANIGELSRYFPLPVQISRGEGGLQAWFEFDNGQPVAVTTDIVARHARLQIPAFAGGFAPPHAAAGGVAQGTAQTPEPIDVTALSGRLSWREKHLGGSGDTALTQQRWSVRDLHAVARNGLQLPSSSGEVLVEYKGGRVTGGAIMAPLIDLNAATPLLKALPVTGDAVNRWLALQPVGSLRQVNLRWRDTGAQAPGARVQLEGAVELDAVGWRAQAGVPGVSGLSGQLSGASGEGSLRLTDSAAAGSRGHGGERGKSTTPAQPGRPPLQLDFGALFEAPLSFEIARGKLAWKRSVAGDGSTRWRIDASDMEIGNNDALAKFAGSWESDKLGPGVANVSGTLVRADVTTVPKYLPTHISADTRQWLKHAVQSGTARDGHFVVKGPLAHFPFSGDEQGVFEIAAPVTGGLLDYAARWPRAEAINTRLVFRGSGMSAQVTGAMMAGLPVTATEVRIKDMAATPALLEIKGGATGPLDAFLRWVVSSPVHDRLDGFLAHARAEGNARLNLALQIPLDDAARTQLNGDLQLSGNRLDLGRDVPVLEAVTGRLRFTQSELRANDIAAEALGGALRLSISSEQGRIKAHAVGSARLERVQERYAYPLLDQLAGLANWELDLLQPHAVPTAAGAAPVDDAVLNLKVVTVSPHWPLDAVMQVGTTPRERSQPITATLTRAVLDKGRDRLTIDVAGQLHGVAERSAPGVNGARTVDRAVLDLGAQRTGLPPRGYSLRGELARLDGDALLAAFAAGAAGGGGRSLGLLNAESASADFVNINLRAGEAVLYGHRFNDVSLRAQPSGQRWRLALRSKEATGVIALDTHTDGAAVEAIAVRLQRLSFPGAVAGAPGTPPLSGAAAGAPATTPPAPSSAPESTRWPKLDLTADSFVSDGRDLGKLEVRAQPSRDEWRIEQVKLSSADGSIEASGRWRAAAQPAAGSRTDVDVVLRWQDAGKFMQRFGLPKGIERGPGSLSGSLGWLGSPAQFSYSRVGGKFALETAGGRFTEMEPGIAKLLGVLSLQSLPRRLSFNFDDLFGKGFAFDEIRAEVTIADGIARTEGFAINGPSARVQIRGSADINRETQDLQVRVYPSLSTATAIGIGIATANPAIGAAALLGQKLARDPIERMLMQEFEVKGTWAHPDVKPMRSTAPAAPVTTP